MTGLSNILGSKPAYLIEVETTNSDIRCSIGLLLTRYDSRRRNRKEEIILTVFYEMRNESNRYQGDIRLFRESGGSYSEGIRARY